ncbi:MAG: glycosyltransferase [Ruminococcus flavefaciens]|nr:glycosyltransferase [Ruminococcus flavefaciens]
MTEKLVSVIIPFYNRIPWCMEAIESVQKQTYSNWEIILINDGSEDDIEAIRAEAQADARIHLLEQENRGVAAARNAGIAAANGFYIALLDSDDLWDPQKLEKQISYMEAHGYRVTHTNYTLFDENGTIREVNTGALEGDILKKLIVSCPLCTPSAVVEKALIDNLHPPFEERFHYGEDGCFWISLAAQTKVGAVREPLTLIRHTETTSADDIEKVRIACVNILSYVLDDPYLSSFSQEILKLSKFIKRLSGKIERKQIIARDREEMPKSLLTVRDEIEKEFERARFYPKVSIIIPVYNGANYMREAINSALDQTYGNIEVIVVNDGSRDNGETDRIARSYGSLIRYYEKPNGGVATALNLGIEKMTGEYFSWLSHDDMYTPNKIEEEVRSLLMQPDKTTVIAEGYQVVNAKGKYLYTVNIHGLYASERMKNAVFLIMRGAVNGCALLIHKSHFERVGLFDPTLPTTQDYDLWFRMFRGQNVCYLKSSNVLSRSHEEQGSKALLSDHVKECDALWTGMMDALTLEEKKAMSGSEFIFYQEVWEFLKSTTGYQKAIRYAQYKMLQAAIDEFDCTNDMKVLKLIYDFMGYQERDMLDNILPLRRKKGIKPRVVFYLIDRYELGGLNRIVLQTAGLISARYDVIITSSQDPLPTGHPTPNGVTEVKLPWNPWDSSNNGAFKLCYLACILKADVLVNSYNCSESQLKIYEMAQYFGIHTIAWNHEFFFLPYWRASLHGCLPKRNEYLRKADTAIWLNSFSAQAYRAFGGNGIVLPNSNPFAGKSGTKQALPEDLLAIGRFNDSCKGLEALLRMFQVILDKRQDVRLWIVGPCDLDVSISSDTNTTYRNLIQELYLPEQALRFEGEVSDVEAFYQKACVHILPSKYEGFGLTILEAATMGLPSVVYGGSGMDDIITNGVDGYTVPAGDWEALADYVLKLLENPELRASMSEAAKAMTDRYAPERIADMWCDVIETILKKPPADRTEYLTTHYSYRPYKDHEEFTALCAREYERCICSLLGGNAFVGQQILPAAVPAMELQWQAECERMQQSFSWRITKPLRLIKKSIILLKAEGLVALLKKVRRRMFVR